LEDNRFGLTPEERKHLGTKPDGVREMENLAGILAFAGLLLVAALIITASLIARAHEHGNSGPITTTPPSKPATPVSTVLHDHPGASDEYQRDSTHQQLTNQSTP